MPYRRPAIEVIQEFQNAVAALALPALPAVVVGPGFEIKDDINAGTYDSTLTTYAYSGIAAGAIVDLSDTPDETDEANVHKSVGVKLTNVFLRKIPVSGASPITGVLDTASGVPNVFTDATVGAFSTFDPDAAGAPLFYVDVVSGAGIVAADLGRKLIIEKVDDNTLLVATEWQSVVPLVAVTYRILEFRASEVFPETSFTSSGIIKAASGVTLPTALESVTDATPLVIVEATVLLAWRALRVDLANILTGFTDTDSLKAVFGVDAIVPANIGAFAVNLALQNTTTSVAFTGLNDDFFTNEENAYTSALESLESKDVYGIALLTQNTAVHQLGKSHVEGLSVSTKGRERVCFVNRELTTIEVMSPASGIGTKTSAGTGNGLTTVGTLFRDPTNGTFITDDVAAGQFLEISDYIGAAVAPVITNIGVAGVTTYSYKVVGIDSDGNKTAGSANGSTATGNALLTVANFNRVTFTAIDGAVSYDIYRTVGGATQGKIANVLSPLVILDDTGLVGDATTAPTTGHIPVPHHTFLVGERHEIASVQSELQLTLAADATDGGSVGVLITAVVYRVTRDLSRDEEATLIAGYSSSLGSRRVVATWPDTVAVSVNAVATLVPGYFVGAVLAGMTAGLPSQAGFTNLTMVGFVGRENSDDRYTDDQLDIIAGGGTLVLTQPVPEAALSVRHQLTTDVSTIFFQEFSVTKNVDLLARFFRNLYKPFIGIYNITEGLFDILKTRGEAGITFLKKQRVPRVGPPIRQASILRISESVDQPDSVEIDIDVSVPLPLNNITLTLLV